MLTYLFFYSLKFFTILLPSIQKDIYFWDDIVFKPNKPTFQLLNIFPKVLLTKF